MVLKLAVTVLSPVYIFRQSDQTDLNFFQSIKKKWSMIEKIGYVGLGI